MGEVVNLRLARKTKRREVATAQAAGHRALHGRSKAERLAEAAEAGRREQLLDGVRRDPA